MHKIHSKDRKGFTLIELLVVIAIIAVLAVVVILSLNPAELLRQARDSNRVSDLATMKSAISLYLADVSTPNLASSTGGYSDIYYSQSGMPTVTSTVSGFATMSSANATGTDSRSIDSTGWIPVNFSEISSGAPIGSLPVDPVNSTSSLASFGGAPLTYGYAATGTSLSFKLTAHMESSKYGSGGTNEQNDGGTSSSTYEQGTVLTL